MKRILVVVLTILVLIFSMCGCGSDTEGGAANNDEKKSEDLLKQIAKEAGIPELSSQTVEEDFKSDGKVRQYGLGVEKFEITDVNLDPDGKREVVSCSVLASNGYCTVEETADISYQFIEDSKSWSKERCIIKSSSITPKFYPSEEDIKVQVRSNSRYDSGANLDIAIISQGTVNEDPLSYSALAQTITPRKEQGLYYNYTETDTYKVAFKFDIAGGWNPSTTLDSTTRDYSVKTSIGGHYEGTVAPEDADTGLVLNEIRYSFDLSVSDDGKDVVLSNVKFGRIDSAYPITNQSEIRESIQRGEPLSFYMSSPEGTENRKYVGVASLIENGSELKMHFDRARHDDAGWGRNITYSVTLHY